MPQPIVFSEVLKLHDSTNYNVGQKHWVCYGGYLVFPMAGTIKLVDSFNKPIGKARVISTETKFQEFLTDGDAERCGFKRFTELGYYLEFQNPAEGQLVTFVNFERLE